MNVILGALDALDSTDGLYMNVSIELNYHYYFFLEQARYNRFNFKKEQEAFASLYGKKFHTGYLFWLYAFNPGLYNKFLQLKRSNSLAGNSFLEYLT